MTLSQCYMCSGIPSDTNQLSQEKRMSRLIEYSIDNFDILSILSIIFEMKMGENYHCYELLKFGCKYIVFPFAR